MRRPLALVADDNKVCAIVAVSFLQRFGFSVHKVENGREAVEECRNFNFDVILMDCDMPELDGMQATTLIRENELNKQSVIIGITAGSTFKDCVESGMDDHIQKPLRMQALEETLKRWGSLPLQNRDEVRRVRSVLQARRQELALQFKDLQLQYLKLRAQHLQLALQKSERERTRSNFEPQAEREAELSRLRERLERRERALKAREIFLERREQAALLDENKLRDAL